MTLQELADKVNEALANGGGEGHVKLCVPLLSELSCYIRSLEIGNADGMWIIRVDGRLPGA